MPPADDPTEAKQSGRREAMATVVRALSVGLGAGGIATILATWADPTGPSAKFAGLVGVGVGGLSGFYEAQVKKRRGMLLAEAEGRRAMIEAESGSDRAARIEVERHHEECRKELTSVRSQVAGFERRCVEMEAKIEEMRAENAAERRQHDVNLAAAYQRVQQAVDTSQKLADQLFHRDGPSHDR